MTSENYTTWKVTLLDGTVETAMGRLTVNDDVLWITQRAYGATLQQVAYPLVSIQKWERET